VFNLTPPSVDPTPPLRSAKVVASITSSVNPTPPLMSAKVVSPVTSSVNPTLPLKSVKVVDPVPPSIDPTLPLESKPDTSHVFLVDTGSIVSGGIPPFPAKTPPSNEAILFYWGVLSRRRPPSHIPFNITVKFFGWYIPQTLIDKGLSVSILSSISWQSLGYPQVIPVTQTLFSFNKRTRHPLGILPQFPVTLGGKTVFIDVMVVQDPLDFYLLLRRDYVYAMKAIVSTLFHVTTFPHNGGIVAIDQLSCVSLDLSTNPMTSLDGSYQQLVSPPPQVNYVALSPMPLATNEDDLDPVVDMVISLVGLLEPDLITPITDLDMCSFQRILLPSNEDLLEAMTEFVP
jgi:hypothetical protein